MDNRIRNAVPINLTERIGKMHVELLGVATAVGQADRMQDRGLGPAAFWWSVW
jgi:hypothetical protein